MRSSKAAGKDAEEYEGQFLHQTIGGRIKSNSTKYGSHKLNRHYTASSLTPPSASSSSGSPGSSASAVSSYLENLPSISNVSAPPRPTRPPGGLLGISNGRGMGYGRTLGASYDSPITTHGSFNGHVRSGANLYGGTQGSGLSPTKSGSSGHHHRPTLSVFPIQKAMEISLKEWKLLQAASNRGEASSLSTGPSSGMAFVRELRLRHARGVNITEHSDKEEDIIVRQFGDDTTEGNVAKMDSYSQGLNGSRIPGTEDISKSFMATTRTVHEHGDIRIQRPAIASFDAKMQYPGIAHLPHSLTPQTSAVAVRLSPTKSVHPTGAWQQQQHYLNKDHYLQPQQQRQPFSLLSRNFCADFRLNQSTATYFVKFAISASILTTFFFYPYFLLNLRICCSRSPQTPRLISCAFALLCRRKEAISFALCRRFW